MELRTARLRLRPYREADFETLFRELVLDPAVVSLWHDYADPKLTVGEKRAMAERDLGSWIEEGIAAGYPTWILEAADPALGTLGEFVGAAGVFPPENEWGPEPEVGCLLASRHHGRGLATEGLSAVIADATERLGIPILVAIIDEENAASVRLVDKCGFVLERLLHGRRRRRVPALRAAGRRRRAAIMPPMPDLDHPDAFATRAVHAGAEPDEVAGAVSPPIYQTSTYAQDGVGRPRAGYEYARTQNPTRERLERAVAELEGGAFGIAFASGSAATATLAELVAPGEEIVVGDDVYGGTFRFFERVARPRGVDARYVDLAADPGPALAGALSPRTRLVWFETPSNPLLKVTDIAAVVGAVAGHAGARGERPLVVIDSTFASPALQRPLELGADVVFHSATKYLGGHSDTVNGVVVTSDAAVAEQLRFLQNAMGAVPGPQDCFLVLRGLRTLALRVERHSANALAVARALAARDDVDWLRYPGITDGRHAHPGAAIAARQMRLGERRRGARVRRDDQLRPRRRWAPRTFRAGSCRSPWPSGRDSGPSRNRSAASSRSSRCRPS